MQANLGRYIYLAAAVAEIVMCLLALWGAFGPTTSKLFSRSVPVPIWVLALGALPVLIYLGARSRPSAQTSARRGPEVFEQAKQLVRSSDPNSPLALPSMVLGKNAAGISLWVYVHQFGYGIRKFSHSSYLVAHATAWGETRKNVFALYREPSKWKPPSDPKWWLWLQDAGGPGKWWDYPDSNAIKPDWHHFAIRWNHSEQPLEILIDGHVVISAKDYRKYWPRDLTGHILFGCCPGKLEHHYAETYFWRIQMLDSFPTDDWIKNERSKTPPAVSG